KSIDRISYEDIPKDSLIYEESMEIFKSVTIRPLLLPAKAIYAKKGYYFRFYLCVEDGGYVASGTIYNNERIDIGYRHGDRFHWEHYRIVDEGRLKELYPLLGVPVSEQPPEAAEATELTMVQPFRNSSENEFEPVPLPQSLQGKIEPRSYQLAGNEGSNSRDGISVAAADAAFPAEEVLLRFHNENEHPAMSSLAYRLYAWLDEAWVQQPFSPGYDSFRQLGISIEPGESAYMLCLLKGEAFTPDSLELRDGELPPGRYLLEVQVSSNMEQGKESRSAYYADFSIIEE
ncbi:MAG: hypothetical protein IJP07_07675, partial [Firmicutes bacterium]|nr:hypothetical protein [Bacillota bacterium]